MNTEQTRKNIFKYTLGTINSWKKTQHQFSNLLKRSAQPKLKDFVLKNTQETIIEEVKRGNFN